MEPQFQFVKLFFCIFKRFNAREPNWRQRKNENIKSTSKSIFTHKDI